MATPTALRRPPISEALIDLACAVPAPQEAFEAFARNFETRFPKRIVRKGFRGLLRVEDGKIVPPTMEDTGFDGLLLSTEDESLRVQFRTTGFTVNNLKSYVGGERLTEMALEMWTSFATEFRVTAVTRVAFRYINKLELPFEPGDDFKRFLVAPPDTPPGSPQMLSEFLSRVVAHDESRDATAIITQRKEPDPAKPVVLDIDVFKAGVFSAESKELGPLLDQLRTLKNEIFFAYLTSEAIGLYV